MWKTSRHLKRSLGRALAATCVLLATSEAVGDGFLAKSARYGGSLEERSQEAIIIFESSSVRKKAVEDLILKITVEGDAEEFAWVIPFPNQPEVKEADSKLFKELFDYVEYRLNARKKSPKKWKFGGAGGGAFAEDVEVLSREIVGSYDVAVVRENTPGTLNQWLEDEGYRRIEEGEDVIGFYREKGYVFSCIKVSDAKLKGDTPVDLHPLRFTFKTGGRDGIYFPMKMTGLQKEPFDVNLYVFSPMWLNDRLNRYGYEHRGLRLKYRDPSHAPTRPNTGRNWSQPFGDQGRTLAALFRELHPGKRYHLTNIQAFQLSPADVRRWADDLWLFPYYLETRFIPYDARRGGPASTAYAHSAGR